MTTTMSNGRPTLDQRRAKHAWDAVERAIQGEGAHRRQDTKQFGGETKKLPVRIVGSGLGQALAFLHAKNKVPGLLDELNDWVFQQLPDRNNAERDLLKRIVNGDSQFLRRVTDEVLAYLQWLTRFAEAKGLMKEQD